MYYSLISLFFFSLQTPPQGTSLQVCLGTCVNPTRLNAQKWNCWAMEIALSQFYLLSTASIPISIPTQSVWVPFSSHSHQQKVPLDVSLLPISYVKKSHHTDAYIAFPWLLMRWCYCTSSHRVSFMPKAKMWGLSSA